MDEIALHIDFLLHTHDCVIVPGLGGFVVNVTGVEKNGLWGLNAPSFELMFNSKLTYNDGLLAESLMRTNNVSYEIAIKQIESSNEELRGELMNNEEVVWDNLGSFKTNKENNLIFLPNKAYVRPQFFGLSSARLKPAAFKLSQTNDKENLISVGSFFQYVSTAVAVAIFLFLVVVSYNNYIPQSQRAEIVSKPLIFSKGPSLTATPKVIEPQVVANKEMKPIAEAETIAVAEVDNEIAQSSVSSTVNYYIVVGVYGVKDTADKTLSTLKNEGFQSASMIDRPMRLDVYAASFSTKKQAYTFLHKFKAENPKYKDAWVLKR